MKNQFLQKPRKSASLPRPSNYIALMPGIGIEIGNVGLLREEPFASTPQAID
jgi:hypothetical protein